MKTEIPTQGMATNTTVSLTAFVVTILVLCAPPQWKHIEEMQQQKTQWAGPRISWMNTCNAWQNATECVNDIMCAFLNLTQ